MEEWNNTENQGNNLTGQEVANEGNALDSNGQGNKGNKKKKFLGLKIALGVMAVLVIGCIVAFCHPTIRRQILMMVSPKSYYVMTEVENIENVADYISDLYEKSVKQLQLQTEGIKKNQVEFKLDLEKTYIDALGLEEILPVDFIVSNITDNKNNKQKMGAELNLGGELFLAVNMLMDMGLDGYGDIYLQVPQFSSSYLYTLLEGTDKTDSETKKEIERYQKIYDNYLKNPTDKELLEKLIIRYGKIVIEGPEKVSLEKNAEYSLNGEMQKMTKIIVSITEKDIKEYCKKIVETAKNDDDLKQELVRLEICTEEGYTDIIEKMKESLSEDNDKASEKVIMEVWVDKKGNIVGRDFEFEEEDNNTGFYYHTGSQEEIDYLESGFYETDKDNLQYTIKANRKKEDTGYSGEIVLESEDKKQAKIVYDGVALADENYNSYNGNFTLEIDKVSGVTFQLTLAGAENKQDTKLEVIVENEKLCTLEVCQTTEDADEVVYPPDGKIYNVDKTEDMLEYMEGMDREKLEELQNKIEKISEIVGALSGDEELGQKFSDILPDTVS